MADKLLHLMFWLCFVGLILIVTTMALGNESAPMSCVHGVPGGATRGCQICITESRRLPPIPRDDYATAYRAAQTSGRPLVVLVGAEWCQPCREVRRFEPTLRKLGHYAHVDADRERPLAVRLIGARPLPVLVVYRWQQAARTWRVERRLVGKGLIETAIREELEKQK